MKQILGFACLIGACSIAHAASVDTSDAGTIAAFQTGATVNTLEAVPTRTPQAITSYTTGDPVDVVKTMPCGPVPLTKPKAGGTFGSEKRLDRSLAAPQRAACRRLC